MIFLDLRHPQTCKTGKKKKKRFFFLLIWSVGKKGMTVRGMYSTCVLIFLKVVIERLYISSELTAV